MHYFPLKSNPASCSDWLEFRFTKKPQTVCAFLAVAYFQLHAAEKNLEQAWLVFSHCWLRKWAFPLIVLLHCMYPTFDAYWLVKVRKERALPTIQTPFANTVQTRSAKNYANIQDACLKSRSMLTSRPGPKPARQLHLDLAFRLYSLSLDVSAENVNHYISMCWGFTNYCGIPPIQNT